MSPPVRAELDGIVDEVRPHVLQEPLVAREFDLVEVDIEIDLLFRPLALKGQNALPYLLVEAEALALGVDGLTVKL